MPKSKRHIIRKRYLAVIYTYEAKGESSRFRFQHSDAAKKFAAAQCLRDAVYQVVVWNLYFGKYTGPGTYPGTVFSTTKHPKTTHHV